MFQDAFVKLDREESRKLLDEINPVLTDTEFDGDTVTILGHKLPFYPGYRFLEVVDYESVPNRKRYIVHKPGDVVVLDWSNGPVYALNDRVPVKLDESTIADYVRFFFRYVRGPKGRFILAEIVDDIRWRDEPPSAARKAVSKMITPLHIAPDENSDEKAKGFDIAACMTFGDSLYKAHIKVSSSGDVSLSDQELLIEDMPLLDDVLE